MYYTLLKSIPMHIKSLTNTNNTPCTQRTFVENILARLNKIFYKLEIKNPAKKSKTQINGKSFFENKSILLSLISSYILVFFVIAHDIYIYMSFKTFKNWNAVSSFAKEYIPFHFQIKKIVCFLRR
jgi:hypothetical protein